LPHALTSVETETGDVWDQFFTIETTAASSESASQASELIAA